MAQQLVPFVRPGGIGSLRETVKLSDQPPTPELPHSIEAEQALLGALMIDNRLIEDVQMKLRAEHFFQPLHGRVYGKLLELTNRTMIANPVTLKAALLGDEGLKAAGGPTYLVSLVESIGPIFAVNEYAQHIYELALLRELARVGREMAAQALDTACELEPKEQVEAAEMALYAVAEQGEVQGAVKSFHEASRAAVAMVERAFKSGGNISGVTTGFRGINLKTGGLHNSDLVIIAGRPAMGKTALATNMAFAAARRFMLEQSDGGETGAPVAFFSLEMSSDQLATRILAEQSGIPSENLRMGKIDAADFRNLARAAQELNALPLYIDDTPALTIAALRTRARRLKRRKGIGLVVVDYLQLLQGSGRNSGDNRVQEVSEITRGLKTLAKELGVPVLALSQLSRAVEARPDNRPQLSDLRESGSIEQDADIVMFVYREEYYHDLHRPREPGGDSAPSDRSKWDEWQRKKQEIEGFAEVIIGKQRHGATGTVKLLFHKATTKFDDFGGEGERPAWT